jgi:D-arabinose 1-dehydrogenase-like Zn-dependent alcohol dehydrogenase
LHARRTAWSVLAAGSAGGQIVLPHRAALRRGRLNFSAMTGIRPMIETYPIEKAQEAYDRMMSNQARFRVVLTTGN